MIRAIKQFEPPKTYASVATLERAVESVDRYLLGAAMVRIGEKVVNGKIRYFPIFCNVSEANDYGMIAAHGFIVVN